MKTATMWWQVTKYLVTDPSEFYEKLTGQDSHTGPLSFAAISSVVAGAVLGAILFLFSITDPVDAVIGFALVFVLFSVLLYVGFLVESLVAHAVLAVTGDRGLDRTLEAFAYPTAIRTTTVWIPIVNLGTGLYGVYLQFKGIETLHDTTTGKAAAVVIFTMLFSWIFVAAAVLILFAVLGAFLLELGAQTGAPPS